MTTKERILEMLKTGPCTAKQIHEADPKIPTGSISSSLFKLLSEKEIKVIGKDGKARVYEIADHEGAFEKIPEGFKPNDNKLTRLETLALSILDQVEELLEEVKIHRSVIDKMERVRDVLK